MIALDERSVISTILIPPSNNALAKGIASSTESISITGITAAFFIFFTISESLNSTEHDLGFHVKKF